MSALLDVSQVCKTFTRGGLFSSRRIHAVNDVSFRIDAAKPEIFTIIGESGSGKTTLSRMILNIEQPTSGALVFDGIDLATVRSSADRMAFMHKVQPIFQNPVRSLQPAEAARSLPVHDKAPVSRGRRSDRHRCGRR